MAYETSPITPVEVIDAQGAFGDASIAQREPGAGPPTLSERYLQSPLLFWFSQGLLLVPLGLFLLQGFLEEIGERGIARDINLFLFGTRHTIVGDVLPVLLLPALGILLALARIRDAKPGLDRKATIWLTVVAMAGIGVVLAYALVENIGSLLR